MSNETKQTAVEIIESALDKYFSYEYNKNKATPFVKFDLYESLKQAKEMERVEHMKTWTKAIDQTQERAWNVIRAYDDFDDYYEQTYGGNK